jgi:hypothetical protein
MLFSLVMFMTFSVLPVTGHIIYVVYRTQVDFFVLYLQKQFNLVGTNAEVRAMVYTWVQRLLIPKLLFKHKYLFEVLIFQYALACGILFSVEFLFFLSDYLLTGQLSGWDKTFWELCCHLSKASV